MRQKNKKIRRTIHQWHGFFKTIPASNACSDDVSGKEAHSEAKSKARSLPTTVVASKATATTTLKTYIVYRMFCSGPRPFMLKKLAIRPAHMIIFASNVAIPVLDRRGVFSFSVYQIIFIVLFSKKQITFSVSCFS
jgi:hypothetical protein